MNHLIQPTKTQEWTAEQEWARQALIDGLEREFGMDWSEVLKEQAFETQGLNAMEQYEYLSKGGR